MRRLAATAIAAVLAATGFTTASPASADAVYHTQHIALQPVGSAPLRTGFVQNIHVNGPKIYAQERYALVGAAPLTTYTVTLQVYIEDTSCTTAPIALESIAFTTNRAGNGVGRFTLPPSPLTDALAGATLGVVWQLSIGGSVSDGGTLAYQTACSTVTLD